MSAPNNPDIVSVDFRSGEVTLASGDTEATYSLQSPEGFAAVGKAWLRAGWDAKYVYSFTWLGRPIIQLPEDMFRLQELIYTAKPDVLIETGVAHGGSLVFYASVFHAMGRGRVVGVDIEIRPHNRSAIEAHELSSLISLVEGNSVQPDTFDSVKTKINPGDSVLVTLDSNHSKDHVLEELRLYSTLVTPGSYIVAMDGIMQELGDAPRSAPDWTWNNPQTAVKEFLEESPEFVLEEPQFLFNEGVVKTRVTYWPAAFLRRRDQ